MGAQQILMVILSVIIIGAAVAITVTTFGTKQHILSEQQLRLELMRQCVAAQSWFRAYSSARGETQALSVTSTCIPDIAKFIDHNADDEGVIIVDIGRFVYATASDKDDNNTTITITATAKSGAPTLVATVNLSGGNHETDIDTNWISIVN